MSKKGPLRYVSGVYKIVNLVTGDFYVGSSKDIGLRWKQHWQPATHRMHPNSKLYQDMEKYRKKNFTILILCLVSTEYLKQVEQELIEMLMPTYNEMYSYGNDKERHRTLVNEYRSVLCIYNGEELTRSALTHRFERKGIEHAYKETKKYLKGE